eukprot:m.61177 g.61177  ORF g.61177 m.61177 type:complete len:220 (+) comp34977_c0_seq7:649-1308(+)
MEQIDWFHHVTEATQEVIERSRLASPSKHKRRMNWDYDGCLTDIPCKGTWFTATLYNGKLPTISPYPANPACPAEKMYDRVSIKVSPTSSTLELENDENWGLYFVKERQMLQYPTKQCCVAFIPIPNRPQCLKNWLHSSKKRNEITKIDHFDNKYLYFDRDHKPHSWKCPPVTIFDEKLGFWKPAPVQIWTKVFVATDFIDVSGIQESDKQWDKVLKRR